MPVEQKNEETGEVTLLYTKAEQDAEIEKVKADTTKTVTEKDKEIERLTKLNIDKTNNFKKFSEMTEAERAGYDANTLELLKRDDLKQTEIATLKKSLEEKNTKDALALKTGVLTKFHQNDEATKKVIEEKYALLSAMPETTEEEIGKRALEASKLAGISIDSQNPLYAVYSGEPPVRKDSKDYTDTAAGEQAAALVRSAMDLPQPKK